MSYQYLIFDLDDTLFDFKGGEQVGLEHVLAAHHFTKDEIKTAIPIYEKINRQLWSDFEAGKIEKKTIQQTRFDRLLKTLSMPGDGAAFEQAYRAELNHNYRLIPGAKDLLATLQAAHFHLIAGTNGETQTQYLRLEHTGLDDYFEQVYISDELGVAKPNPEFFGKIFNDNHQMNRSNTVMIGDGVASDMRGGEAAGIDTIWYNPNKMVQPKIIHPTVTVNNYHDLVQALNDN